MVVIENLKPFIFVWIRGKNFPLAELNAAQAAAVALGLDTVRCKIRRGQDIAPALEVLKGNADALYVCIDPLVNTNGVRINALVLAARLPTMHGSRDNIDAGGMVSHGPDTTDLFRRAARVCRQNLARGEAGRSSGRAANEVRVGHQSQGCQGARPGDFVDAARPRRRGDRIGIPCSA
jgi:ABC-type uncharacterized transport system substrate-binding protein